MSDAIMDWDPDLAGVLNIKYGNLDKDGRLDMLCDAIHIANRQKMDNVRSWLSELAEVMLEEGQPDAPAIEGLSKIEDDEALKTWLSFTIELLWV